MNLDFLNKNLSNAALLLWSTPWFIPHAMGWGWRNISLYVHAVGQRYSNYIFRYSTIFYIQVFPFDSCC